MLVRYQRREIKIDRLGEREGCQKGKSSENEKEKEKKTEKKNESLTNPERKVLMCYLPSPEHGYERS